MNKLAPKGIKICPGCPPKEIPTLTFPKFRLSKPVPKDTMKVVTLVDLDKYKNGANKNKPKGLF